VAQALLPAWFLERSTRGYEISPQFQFSLFQFLSPPDYATVTAVSLNRTQILGALILAAIALAILLLRWKFAH
jgi:hypothetical protein